MRRTGWSSATASSKAAPVRATASIAFRTAWTSAITMRTPKATVNTVFSVTCDGRTSLSSAATGEAILPRTRGPEQHLLRRTAARPGGLDGGLATGLAVGALAGGGRSGRLA